MTHDKKSIKATIREKLGNDEKVFNFVEPFRDEDVYGWYEEVSGESYRALFDRVIFARYKKLAEKMIRDEK